MSLDGWTDGFIWMWPCVLLLFFYVRLTFLSCFCWLYENVRIVENTIMCCRQWWNYSESNIADTLHDRCISARYIYPQKCACKHRHTSTQLINAKIEDQIVATKVRLIVTLHLQKEQNSPVVNPSDFTKRKKKEKRSSSAKTQEP